MSSMRGPSQDSKNISEMGRITRESSFPELAQYAIAKHYLVPYPGKPDNRPQEVNRPQHGGVHACNTAMLIDLLIELYRKYKPELLKWPDGSDFTEEDIKRIKLAALYHDSANTSEANGDAKEHAERYINDLILLGYKWEGRSKLKLISLRLAIQYKDDSNDDDILRKLIHDADCLEYLRMLRGKTDNFKRELLGIYNDLSDNPDFLAELEEIIQNHNETYMYFERGSNLMNGIKVGNLHRKCELAPNCYQAVEQVHRDLLIDEVIMELLRRGISVDYSQITIDFIQLSIRELYRRKSTARVIADHLEKQLSIESKGEKSSEEAIALFHSGGCFVRILKASEIKSELETLDENAKVLAEEGIENAASMKQYLEEQKGSDVFTPAGFKWRPCSFIREGISASLFSGDVGLIIDPRSQSSQHSHFYKRNVRSVTAASGSFPYKSKKGPIKDKECIEALREKMQEMEQRRRGLIDDSNLHYFGQKQLGWNEILGTYQKEAVLGIIVGDTRNSARDALLLRAHLGQPFRSFYRYTAESGLVALSLNEVIEQTKVKELKTTDTLNERIQHLNLKINQMNPVFSIQESPPEKKILSIQLKKGYTVSKEYSVINRMITINLNGVDPTKADKIRFVMRNLLRFCPKNEGIWDMMELFTKIDLNENNGVISANLEGLDSSSKKITEFIQDQIIRKLDNLISQDLTLELAQAQEEIEIKKALIKPITASSLKKIKDIICISRIPLQYQFQHPDDPTISCLAWVKNGKPLIEFHIDQHSYDYPSSLLPEIAKLFVQENILELNHLSQEADKKDLLLKIGLKDLNFSLEEKPRKVVLKIELTVTDPARKEEIIKQFIDSLSFNNPKKISIVSNEADLSKVSLLAPDVQNIDLIKAKLNQLLQEATYPPTYQTQERISIEKPSVSGLFSSENVHASNERNPPQGEQKKYR